MRWIKKYRLVIFIALILSAFIKPAVCFLILGLLFSYLGIMAIRLVSRLKKTGIGITGGLLKYDADGDGYKTPVVAFTSLGGEYVEDRPSVYSSSDLSKVRSYKHSIGLPVSVIYNPADPKEFMLVSNNGFNQVVFLFFTIVGLFFVGLSIASFLGHIKLG